MKHVEFCTEKVIKEKGPNIAEHSASFFQVFILLKYNPLNNSMIGTSVIMS